MAGPHRSHWIKKAVKHPGALRAKAQAAGETTKQYAEKHKHDSGVTGSQARLGLTLMRIRPSGPHKAEPIFKRT